MKDFHVFCNKTWLKQLRKASSLNTWRSSIVITLLDTPGIKKQIKSAELFSNTMLFLDYKELPISVCFPELFVHISVALFPVSVLF